MKINAPHDVARLQARLRAVKDRDSKPYFAGRINGQADSFLGRALCRFQVDHLLAPPVGMPPAVAQDLGFGKEKLATVAAGEATDRLIREMAPIYLQSMLILEGSITHYVKQDPVSIGNIERTIRSLSLNSTFSKNVICFVQAIYNEIGIMLRHDPTWPDYHGSKNELPICFEPITFLDQDGKLSHTNSFLSTIRDNDPAFIETVANKIFDVASQYGLSVKKINKKNICFLITDILDDKLLTLVSRANPSRWYYQGGQISPREQAYINRTVDRLIVQIQIYRPSYRYDVIVPINPRTRKPSGYNFRDIQFLERELTRTVSRYKIYEHTVVFRGNLAPGTYTRSDRNHRRQLNTLLWNSIRNDISLARRLEREYPGITNHLRPGRKGGITDSPPPGMRLHHHYREGVVEYVPTSQHSATGSIQNLLHPGGLGGRATWGGGRNRR